MKSKPEDDQQLKDEERAGKKSPALYVMRGKVRRDEQGQQTEESFQPLLPGKPDPSRP
jgi:hypothetical protein